MKSYITAAIISVAFIISTVLLVSAFKNRHANEDTISVTGLGSTDFVSDLIVWNSSFSKKSNDLKSAYASLERDRNALRSYLVSKGIKENEIVFSSVNIAKDFENRYDQQYNIRSQVFTGYTLTQNVQVESKEVEKIEGISREVTELINSGVELYSNPPQYYYTKLAELKLKMIAEATQDAKLRAEQIAQNAGARLGDLKKADMGVFQIIAQNSSEEYSWGGSFNTSSKKKTATITMKLVYQVD
ncbi:hypothetical protein SAMN05421747_105146 [Parapedobacter composti]|uniref:SIMPL domain-containing protein n=1 Tax=Parapedobacter composti TaxID=623281 RepID=A0A1I1GYD1_9SPHI|nr:SIMPL domain-containing protein [Parapedobacter composti]SFC16496.1 hypothetical protein SAMN05421747_105146 [Parapedobacter composti]